MKLRGYHSARSGVPWPSHSVLLPAVDSSCRKNWNRLYLCRLSRALDSAEFPALAARFWGWNRRSVRPEYNADVWHGSLPSGILRRGPIGPQTLLVLRSPISLFHNQILRDPTRDAREAVAGMGTRARFSVRGTPSRQPIAHAGKTLSWGTEGCRIKSVRILNSASMIDDMCHIKIYVPVTADRSDYPNRRRPDALVANQRRK